MASKKRKKLSRNALTALAILGASIVVTIGYTIFSQNTRPAQINLVGSATGTVTLALSPATVDVTPNTDKTIDVTMDTGGSTVTAAQVALTYDPAKVGTPVVTQGTFLPNTIAAATVGNGTITFTYSSPVSAGSGATGTGTIATIKIHPTVVGTSNIDFTASTEISAAGATSNVLASANSASVVVADQAASATPSVTPSVAPSTGASAAPSVSPSPSPSTAANAACPGFVGSTVSPSTVQSGKTITITCDYGQVLDCVIPMSTATTNFPGCTYTGYNGTKASFSCPAPTTPGTYAQLCGFYKTDSCTGKGLPAACSNAGQTFTVTAASSPSPSPSAAATSPLTTLRATATCNTLSFSWDKINVASGYIIDIANNSGFNNVQSSGTLGSDKVGYAFSNLASATTYYARLTGTGIPDYPHYTNLTITTNQSCAAVVAQVISTPAPATPKPTVKPATVAPTIAPTTQNTDNTVPPTYTAPTDYGASPLPSFLIPSDTAAPSSAPTGFFGVIGQVWQTIINTVLSIFNPSATTTQP